MNLQFQGNNTNLTQARGIVLSFLCKLTMFRQNIARSDMRQLDVNDNITITDDKL